MAGWQEVAAEIRILEAASADVSFADWMNDFSDEDGF